jgi:hypothetical protein
VAATAASAITKSNYARRWLLLPKAEEPIAIHRELAIHAEEINQKPDGTPKGIIALRG